MAVEVVSEERVCITQHEQREYDACNWENPDFPGDHWMDDGETGPGRYACFQITLSWEIFYPILGVTCNWLSAAIYRILMLFPQRRR